MTISFKDLAGHFQINRYVTIVPILNDIGTLIEVDICAICLNLWHVSGHALQSVSKSPH